MRHYTSDELSEIMQDREDVKPKFKRLIDMFAAAVPELASEDDREEFLTLILTNSLGIAAQAKLVGTEPDTALDEMIVQTFTAGIELGRELARREGS